MHMTGQKKNDIIRPSNHRVVWNERSPTPPECAFVIAQEQKLEQLDDSSSGVHTLPIDTWETRYGYKRVRLLIPAPKRLLESWR